MQDPVFLKVIKYMSAIDTAARVVVIIVCCDRQLSDSGLTAEKKMAEKQQQRDQEAIW